MIPRIKDVKPLVNFRLFVVFDNGQERIYNVKEDIDTIPQYKDLETVPGLFRQVRLDESRACIYWNEYIDLPSDAVLECSIPANTGK